MTLCWVRPLPSGCSLSVPIASLALSLCRGTWGPARDRRNLAKTFYFSYLTFLICKMEVES